MIENVEKYFRDDVPNGLYSVTLTKGQRIINTKKNINQEKDDIY